MIGLEPQQYLEINVDNDIHLSKSPAECVIDSQIKQEPEVDELAEFALCSYRYLLGPILDEISYYQDEYHQLWLYRALLLKKAYKLNKKERDFKKAVKKANDGLRKYFPFWMDIDFSDHIRYVEQTNLATPDEVYLRQD